MKPFFKPCISIAFYVALCTLIACPVPTIEPVDVTEIEKLKQNQDAGTIDLATTDAGTPETAETDAGTPETAETDAGTSETTETDAGTSETTETDAGTGGEDEESDAGITCTPCADGFAHETNTCNCVDIDECAGANNGGCGNNASCHNSVTPGNAPICNCDFGYQEENGTCVRQCPSAEICRTDLLEAQSICDVYGDVQCVQNNGAESDFECSNGEECQYIIAEQEMRCVTPCGLQSYYDIGAGSDFLCGILLDKPGIDCVGNIEADHYSNLTHQYESISCNEDNICCVKRSESGLLEHQYIQCFTSQETLPTWATEPVISDFLNSLPTSSSSIGPLDLTIADNHGCFSKNADSTLKVFCWGEADHCNGELDCSSGTGCPYAEVPCASGAGNDVMYVKTSNTNTCFSQSGFNGAYLSCRGQSGWGLGGASDLSPQEEAFPFYVSSLTTYFRETGSNTSYNVNGVSDFAFDEKRICVNASLTPNSGNSDQVEKTICAGKTSQNDGAFIGRILANNYGAFSVKGEWLCGIQLGTGGTYSLEGPIYCSNLTDLNNITGFFPFGSSMTFSRLTMTKSTVCGSEKSGGARCAALQGAAAQDLHSHRLGD